MDAWTAFILGLVGSLHCAGMCGPLALALPGAHTTPARFLCGRCAYHLGRILTYGALGLVFGLFGKTLALAGIQRWLSIAVGIALLAGLFSSRKLARWQPITLLARQLQSRMAMLLRQPSVVALLALGLLNGLLPCGLVYVACAGATATGSVPGGALYMVLFGTGTIPLMLAISLSRSLVPLSWRLKLARAIPVSVLLLAMLLILRGMSLGIPYLSPDLSVAGSCCQP